MRAGYWQWNEKIRYSGSGYNSRDNQKPDPGTCTGKLRKNEM
jgi:hypothetical protein